SIGSDTSTTERVGAFHLAAPFIAQHPLFGVGFGTFEAQIFFFTDDQYLHSLIETGVIGVIALIALFVTGWCVARGGRRASTDPEVRHLAQCLAATAAVALISYATFDAFSFPMAAGMTFLLLGCCGAVGRLARVQASAASPSYQSSRQPARA